MSTEPVEPNLSDWIPVSTPPTIEGVYQTKEVKPGYDSIGFQRYKDGIWGGYAETLESHKESYPLNNTVFGHMQTMYPPTFWRGIIECQ